MAMGVPIGDSMNAVNTQCGIARQTRAFKSNWTWKAICIIESARRSSLIRSVIIWLKKRTLARSMHVLDLHCAMSCVM